jgi:nicotinate-nucleotide pyrophosphorylase (carboxylating)
MNKTSLILKYFQKKDQLTVKNKDYQKTLSSLFVWLTENDRVDHDVTSKLFPNRTCTAQIISKDEGILAGLEEIEYLLKTYTELVFKPHLLNGQEFKEKETIAEISGKSHEILAYERTILNILQRLSGIATTTNKLITLINMNKQPKIPISKTDRPEITSDQVKMRYLEEDTRKRDLVGVSEKFGIEAAAMPFIAATRKTPWMSLDKKAVAVGGGLTHRLNLSDGILIKDNHLEVIKKQYKLKTIEEAIEISFRRSDLFGGPTSMDLIEIEVTNEKEAISTINTFQQSQPFNHFNHLAIMFDNFNPSSVKSLLSNLRNLSDLSSIIFEASGGIDEKNIKEWAKTGVDILSLGSLTHSVKASNFSLEII